MPGKAGPAPVCYLTNSFALIRVPRRRKSVIPRHSGSRLYRGGITLPLASGEGRERGEMGREGNRFCW